MSKALSKLWICKAVSMERVCGRREVKGKGGGKGGYLRTAGAGPEAELTYSGNEALTVNLTLFGAVKPLTRPWSGARNRTESSGAENGRGGNGLVRNLLGHKLNTENHIPLTHRHTKFTIADMSL